MKLFNLLCMGAFFALTLVACSGNDDVPAMDNGFITFNSSINKLQTRAADNTWTEGDKVGIYMVPAGGSLSEALVANTKYVASADGMLTPLTVGSELTYPVDGTSVNFVAYYPLCYTLEGTDYIVNVASQELQTDIDLLYATTTDGFSMDSQLKPALQFDHKLSQIQLNIATETPVTSVSDLYVTFTGMNTTANFSLLDGTLSNLGTPETIYAKVTVDQNGVHATAIVLPCDVLTDVKVSFFYKGKKMIVDYPQTKLEAGIRYIHEVTIQNNGNSIPVDWEKTDINNWTDQKGDPINVDTSKGEEIEIPTPEGVNLALNKTVEVSSNSSICSRLTDGDYSSAMWQIESLVQSYFCIDLGNIYDVDKFVTYWDSKAYAQEYEIFVSTDGNTFTSIDSRTEWVTPDPNGVETNILGTPVKARYIKGVFDKTAPNDFLISIYEFEVYKQLK